MRHDARLRPAHPWLRRTGSIAAAVFVAAGLSVAAAPVATSAPAAPASIGIDPASRDSVLQAFQKTWYPASQVATGWTGSTSPCVAGTDTAKAQSATLRAVNFARGLAGRQAVTMDATLSAAAMQAALIQQATGSLNHTPPSTSPCWTQAGSDASGRSNLYGVSSTAVNATAPVDGYLSDSGDGNSFAGHRRWLLFSRLGKIGSGTTTGANALYVIDPASWLPAPAGSKVAAWPSAGYFPESLEPGGRWSVSIPGADFSNATVIVKKGTTRITSTVTSRTDNGYGDNSLVWTVDPHYDISQGDQTFTVTVGNYVLAGVTKTTTYKTTLFDATVGLPKRNIISFPWPTAKRVGVTFDPGATNNNGLTVYYATYTPSVCTTSQNPNRVTTVAAGTCSILAFVPHDPRWPDAPSETRSFTVTG